MGTENDGHHQRFRRPNPERQGTWQLSDQRLGYEFARQYYTVLAASPEHCWRFYAEHVCYYHEAADGTVYIATDRWQLNLLICDHRPSTIAVDSVRTVRCSADLALVIVTAVRFAQSFVVREKSPRTYAVISSVVRHYPDAADDVATEPTRDDNGAQRPAAGTTNNQLFVGHLLISNTHDDLLRSFRDYGTVTRLRLMRGYRRSGKLAKYNYAFVSFAEADAVHAVLAKRPFRLCDGTKVNVRRTKVQRDRGEDRMPGANTEWLCENETPSWMCTRPVRTQQ